MPRAVLIDANIVISLLIASGNPSSTIQRVIECCVREDIPLLVGENTLSEVIDAVGSKPFLARLRPNLERSLSAYLRSWILLPRVQPPMPRHCRDPRDDYLIAHALASAATHLLTGDRDLLALDDGRFPFRILDAAGLARELGKPEGA